MANELDLQPFCGTDEIRPYLMKPFSCGEFTYATDGHIMVRVARRDDAPEDAGHPVKPERLASLLAGVETIPVFECIFDLPDLPDGDEGECSGCDGRGNIHDCPDCTCVCSRCDGSGTEIPRASVMLHSVPFEYRYVKMIAALPNIRLAHPTGSDTPLLFRFDGGVGALMPLRGERGVHFDNVLKQAA